MGVLLLAILVCQGSAGIREGLKVLRGQTVQVALNYKTDSFFQAQFDPITGKTRFKGPVYHMLEHSSQCMNFTYRIMLYSHGAGVKLPNGSWTGGTGNLLRKETDMITVAHTFERHSVLQFTGPTLGYISIFLLDVTAVFKIQRLDWLLHILRMDSNTGVVFIDHSAPPFHVLADLQIRAHVAPSFRIVNGRSCSNS